MPINNCGDPFTETTYKVQTHNIEREVVSFVADIFRAPKDNHWGYVTNGGTEGNLYGLYLARETLPTAKAYFSKAAHYSIKKNLNRNYTYKDIVLSRNNLVKKPFSHVNIDLSGIAKGYAVDLVFNYLISKNISNFLINIGGEIKTYSKNEDFITVAIDDPTNSQQYIEEVLLNNNSIATSGTYIDTVNFEGLEISHITNPKTLRNVSNLNILVSVIHEECAIADGLATGLIAMDPEKIINFSNSNGIASMLTIVRKGELEKSYSTEFLKYLSD